MTNGVGNRTTHVSLRYFALKRSFPIDFRSKSEIPAAGNFLARVQIPVPVEFCRISTISQFDDDGKLIRRYRLNAPSFTPFEFLSRGDMAVTR